jgi:hypothetical protein
MDKPNKSLRRSEKIRSLRDSLAVHAFVSSVLSNGDVGGGVCLPSGGGAWQIGETTARQQAGAIYRKAGLSGRHELAAFFLEDLLGPRSVG